MASSKIKRRPLPPERIELSTPSCLVHALLDWCSSHWAMEALRILLRATSRTDHNEPIRNWKKKMHSRPTQRSQVKNDVRPCRNPGSNRGHLDLQSNALPAELFRRMYDNLRSGHLLQAPISLSAHHDFRPYASLSQDEIAMSYYSGSYYLWVAQTFIQTREKNTHAHTYLRRETKCSVTLVWWLTLPDIMSITCVYMPYLHCVMLT